MTYIEQRKNKECNNALKRVFGNIKKISKVNSNY